MLVQGNGDMAITPHSRPSAPAQQMTGVSPTTTFVQGAARALLRARKATRERTFDLLR